jgi:hypothetical protein
MMNLNLLLLSVAALFNAASAADKVDLGSAINYAILAQTGISSVPASDITGSIAVSPYAATAITGFGLTKAAEDDFSTSTQVTGSAFAPDYSLAVETTLKTAVGDMQTAYENVAGLPADEDNSYNELNEGNISGLTLTPGIYTFTSTISINAGDLTLQGTGVGNNDIFIIRTTKSLLQAASTAVVLTNGALAENVFWQVAEQVEVGASAKMNGVILVKTDALFKTSSSLNGRVLAQTAVNLDHTTIVS